jgi:hypothetical protein
VRHCRGTLIASCWPDGDEISDRWEEALQLKDEITELFSRIDTGAAGVGSGHAKEEDGLV